MPIFLGKVHGRFPVLCLDIHISPAFNQKLHTFIVAVAAVR